jgi:hypothetical protein
VGKLSSAEIECFAFNVSGRCREAYIRPPRTSRVLASDVSVAAPLLCALLAAVLVRVGDAAATEYRGQNHH